MCYPVAMLGQQVGLLTVLKREAQKHPKLGWRFLCRCECGNEVTVPWSNLLTKNTKSCGCLRRRANDLPPGGAARMREYQIWKHMRSRCGDPTNPSYADYGGRGIAVCPEWQKSFSAFLRDMGRRPSPHHTLDRIDNASGYRPDNCRWTDWRTQQNNKRSCRLVTYKGETLTVTQWAERTGIQSQTLGYRIRQGWPLKRAFSPRKRPA